MLARIMNWRNINQNATQKRDLLEVLFKPNHSVIVRDAYTYPQSGLSATAHLVWSLDELNSKPPTSKAMML